MSEISRRKFIVDAAGTAAAATVGGALVGATGCASSPAPAPLIARGPFGPNETIRVACIGLNGRGQSHMSGFSGLRNVEVAALCDVDENILARRARDFEGRQAGGRRVKTYTDMRDVFDDPEIDVVSIATPNHWHALATIWACQAGKDVYVEKPASHNIFEGRQAAGAARRYRRIVQVGAQSRSNEGMREGIRKLHEGAIGDVYMAKGICYKWRDTIGKVDRPQAPPSSVDYAMWLGPAPDAPLMRRSLHYDWHWQWDYGNGDIGNQGPHEMDKARWGLGVGWPSQVHACGGHFMFDDDQQTPNTLIATFHYPEPNKILCFEVRHWMSNHEGGMGSGAGNSIGNIFYGSEGYMVMPSYDSYQIFLGRSREAQPLVRGGGNHFANFIEAVRSRDAATLNCPIEEFRISAAHCHMANISYRTGRKLTWDARRERFAGDREANAMLTRKYRKPFVVKNMA